MVNFRKLMRQVLCLASILATIVVSTGAAQAQDDPAEFANFDSASTIAVDHTGWAAFLEAYIVLSDDNRTLVNYGAVTEADHLALKRYVSTLQETDPTTLNQDEALAYWVNLYNAGTVDLILENYPLISIQLLFSGITPGPWKRSLFEVNGRALTLDQIEHSILRVFWDEPRVHYALNCASIGCPNLAAQPYTGAKLDEMLTDGARTYVNHPRGVTIERRGLKVSSIYKWFKEDFGANDREVIAHIQQYAEPELREELERFRRIRRYEYSWALNDSKSLEE